MEPCFRPGPAIQHLRVLLRLHTTVRSVPTAGRPHRRREYFQTPNTTFPISLLEGRYRIESELGEGGMATVYLGE